MIDIHSHILYGIDDGSRDLEESISLLHTLQEEGVTEIILTPHYMEKTDYMASVSEVKSLIEELQEHTDIKLYIGNEVYISNHLLEMIKAKKISTLNNSRYLLIELPMSTKLRDLEDIIYDLLISDIVPIIAHPERYSYFQEDIKSLDKYVEMGALFQSNYGSLIGKYGKTCEKTVKKLLKNHYITFMGTDIHRTDHPIDLKLAKKKLKKILKKQEVVDDLIYYNIKKVIENKEI